jgi:hypothetical protein
MAQYAVGHQERVKRIAERVAGLPGLRLAGNAYDGIGIPDCIRWDGAEGRKPGVGDWRVSKMVSKSRQPNTTLHRPGLTISVPKAELLFHLAQALKGRGHLQIKNQLLHSRHHRQNQTRWDAPRRAGWYWSPSPSLHLCGVLAGVQVAVEAREVAAAHFQANPVALQKHIAR